MFFLVL